MFRRLDVTRDNELITNRTPLLMIDHSTPDSEVYQRAERLARIARQAMVANEEDLSDTTAKFMKTIENLRDTGLTVEAAYQTIFNRLTLGVDDG